MTNSQIVNISFCPELGCHHSEIIKMAQHSFVRVRVVSLVMVQAVCFQSQGKAVAWGIRLLQILRLGNLTDNLRSNPKSWTMKSSLQTEVSSHKLYYFNLG